MTTTPTMSSNRTTINRWLRTISLGILLFAVTPLLGQPAPLTLDSCQAMARRYYPVSRLYAVISADRDNALKRASTGRLPQLWVGGQATYQSDVTRIPQPNGESISILSQDQYNLYGEVAQPITDLFLVDDQQAVIAANHQVETRKLDVELHQLTDRVNQLYFSILHIDMQSALNKLLQDELNAGRRKMEAAVDGGIAIRSQVTEIDAELLRTRQWDAELAAQRKGITDMLAALIGQPIATDQKLEMPVQPGAPAELLRPELALFAAQRAAADEQIKVVNGNAIPKFSVFLRGGYGRPALDLFKNEFGAYYVGGLRLQWPVSIFYTQGKDRERLALQQFTTDIRRDQFLLQTEMNMSRYQSEIERYATLLRSDEELIGLREAITGAARDQLTNGVMTATDYITYVTAEYRARQQFDVHQLQHLWAMYNLKTEMGHE